MAYVLFQGASLTVKYHTNFVAYQPRPGKNVVFLLHQLGSEYPRHLSEKFKHSRGVGAHLVPDHRQNRHANIEWYDMQTYQYWICSVLRWRVLTRAPGWDPKELQATSEWSCRRLRCLDWQVEFEETWAAPNLQRYYHSIGHLQQCDTCNVRFSASHPPLSGGLWRFLWAKCCSSAFLIAWLRLEISVSSGEGLIQTSTFVLQAKEWVSIASQQSWWDCSSQICDWYEH
jgi:hypothetical protein